MSRVGKKRITMPAKVEVVSKQVLNEDGGIKGTLVSVKGPLGTVEKLFARGIDVHIENGLVWCEPTKDGGASGALWGTVMAHISNMVEGVLKGFKKKMTIEGIGYRAELAGTNLNMALGLSHPVKVPIPKELKVTVEKNVMTVSGADKDLVGQFAATLVALKPPEPYKGKGIIYEGLVVRRKQGKRSTT